MARMGWSLTVAEIPGRGYVLVEVDDEGGSRSSRGTACPTSRRSAELGCEYFGSFSEVAPE